MKACCLLEEEMAVCHCLCSDEANDCNISFRNLFVMMTNLYLFINSVIKIKLSCKSPHQCNSAIYIYLSTQLLKSSYHVNHPTSVILQFF